MVLGLGMGWVNAPSTNSAVAGMPRARAGTAAGIASTSRQVGSSLGVAVFALALVTTGRAGNASAARAAELIEHAETPVPARAA